MPLNPNSTGSPTSKDVADWVAAHAGGGGGGGGASLPVGGTTGQVLDKLSDVDGDAGWVTPGLPSNATPAAASGNGSPGVATTWSRSDHVHPASTSVDSVNGTRIWVPSLQVSGNTFATVPAISSAVALKKTQANMYSVKFTQAWTGTIGTYIVVSGTAGVVVYCGLWNNHATETRPGTNADFFTVTDPISSSYNYSGNTVAFSAGVTYWFGVWCSNVASPPTALVPLLTETCQPTWASGSGTNIFGATTFRFSTITTAADLTSTKPTTQDMYDSAIGSFIGKFS